MDDEPDILEFLHIILEEEDYEVALSRKNGNAKGEIREGQMLRLTQTMLRLFFDILSLFTYYQGFRPTALNTHLK